MLGREATYAEHLEKMQGSVGQERFFAGFDCWYRSLLPSDRKARILDFGCGRGDFLAYLRALGYQELEGFDVISSYSRAITDDIGAVLHITSDPLSFLDSHPESYDVVLLKDVLEHVAPSEMIPLLEGIYRSLRPGGRVIVSGPHAASLTGLYTRYLDFTHTTCFTLPSLDYVLRSAGFDGAHSASPRRRFSIRPARLLLAFARTIWFSTLKFIYFVEAPHDPGNPPHFYNRLVVWADR